MVIICAYMYPFPLGTDFVYIGDMNLEELFLAIVEILDDESEQFVKEALTLWNSYVFFHVYSLLLAKSLHRKLKPT
jgi:hypothetical protein